MTIPKLPTDRVLTIEEITQAYVEHGWTKVLEYDWIEVLRDGPHLKRYRFNANALPCGNSDDVQYQLMFVQLRPTGVLKTCGACGRTGGPITTELAILLSDTRISPAEAWKVIQTTGQHPPVGLQKPNDARRIKIAPPL